MTTQANLGKIWASTGQVTDPGDTKYNLGWLSEIPTFQNFNFVLQNYDKNFLALAEKGRFEWQNNINYIKGGQVIKDFILYTCITNHVNQDPALDTTHSYWTLGYAFGTNSSNLVASHGLLIDEVNTVVLDKWDGNAVTLTNTNAMQSFNTTGAFDNYILGNVKGELVVVNVGNVEVPDGRNIDPILGNSKRLFHEGHPPIQSEVVGTIPANTVDGKLYGRVDGNWVEVVQSNVNGTIPDSASDGDIYARKDGAWVKVVQTSMREIMKYSLPMNIVLTTSFQDIDSFTFETEGGGNRAKAVFTGHNQLKFTGTATVVYYVEFREITDEVISASLGMQVSGSATLPMQYAAQSVDHGFLQPNTQYKAVVKAKLISGSGCEAVGTTISGWTSASIWPA